jgi:hypothetical protein
MVLVGPDQRPVVWQAGRWDEPDAHHRRLTVDASEMALQAELSFTYDDATGFLSLQNVLRHVGRHGEIDLRAANSFAFLVREPVDRMIYLTGGWTEETSIQRAHPDDGVLTLESRSGKTGFQFQPYIALRTQSESYLCQILWSGNWRMQVEPKKDGVLLSGGSTTGTSDIGWPPANRFDCRQCCSAASVDRSTLPPSSSMISGVAGARTATDRSQCSLTVGIPISVSRRLSC